MTSPFVSSSRTRASSARARDVATCSGTESFGSGTNGLSLSSVLPQPLANAWNPVRIDLTKQLNGLGFQDLYSMRHEASHEEAEWMERLRDFLFRVRYDSSSGFQTGHHAGLRHEGSDVVAPDRTTIHVAGKVDDRVPAARHCQ